MGFFTLRPPVKLGTRIAATTLIAILAVQALNAVVFFLLPPPPMPVYSAHAVIETIEEIAQAVFAANKTERPELVKRLAAQNTLHIRWQSSMEPLPPGPPDEPGPRSETLDRVRASLAESLKEKVRAVTVRCRGGPAGPDYRRDRMPPEFKPLAGPIGPNEGDLLLFGGFEIAIEGLDGSWLITEPQWQPRLAGFLRPWIVTVIGALILVSALSAFVARRSIRRLDRLVEAAQKLGRTRNAPPISTAGLNEFGVIAEALNEMQARVQQFLDDRTQMLAAISHDLRTSLTRLRLEAEELPESDAKERLIFDVNEMEHMISATLTFAGDDLKKEPHQRVDLAALLISLCDGFSDRGQSAEYAGPNHAYLFCQAVAMKRAFDNLIGNAIKYGSRANITLTTADGSALVSISDCGPGIPPEKFELAFRPFCRLETSRNRESGGVGLGLTIARDIVRAHGGDIKLRNRPEGGLQVLVRLPAIV